MKSQNELQELLHRIDHRGYPAYKDTRGVYDFGQYRLSIDHVQGDPFAAPSKVSVHVSGKAAGFPKELWETEEKRIALQDFLLRRFSREIEDFSFQAKGSGKSGLMTVSRPGQEILERSACEMNPQNGDLVLRMEIGFPANGRTINSRELEKILFTFMPKCVEKSLYYKAYKAEALQKNANLAEDQTYIRAKLKELGLVAFIANGSILPRESGISKKPMKQAVAFESPASMEVTLELPHAGTMKGMGIRQGITLIVGGGYHGKSTLLQAIELGVYNHIAGDGREYVITDDSAMKVRAEDGRSIHNVDISMFINHLPNGRDTVHFQTEDASGSTSQAANIVEAMEAGTKAFLIDEDTSATNFMVRDELMQRVVSRESEPITPFVDRIRELYEVHGISTILVAGSSGAYFHKADTVIQMDCYHPVDITEAAKREAANYPLTVEAVAMASSPCFERKPKPVRIDDRRMKIKTNGCDTILIGHDAIDMRYVEQLVDQEQMAALGSIMAGMMLHSFDGKKTMTQLVDMVEKQLQMKGFSAISNGSYIASNMAKPRRQEIFACLNRYRKLKVSDF